MVNGCTLWQYGLSSFQAGGTKLEISLPKNQHAQKKLLNFENLYWWSGELLKIRHNLSNKLKIDVLKNVSNKKYAPKYSDDSDDFWHKKLTLKVHDHLFFLFFNSEIGIYFSKFWFQQLYQLVYKLCQHLDKSTDDQNALFDQKSAVAYKF